MITLKNNNCVYFVHGNSIQVMKCIELFRIHKLEAYTDFFAYYEGYKAIAGLVTLNNEGLMIEPFYSDSPMFAYRLYQEIEKYATYGGYRYIIGGTDNPAVGRALKKFGYEPFQKNINQYVKWVAPQKDQSTPHTAILTNQSLET